MLNPVIQIDVIINDPELTLATDDRLWASTGIRALDHVVEAFYSQYSQSFTDALAERALLLLLEHLPLSLIGSDEEKLVHRGHCLTGAFLSNYAAMNTRYGVSHAVGHKIGPMWNIPHGITSCVSLPFAMRFVGARFPERFERMAAALKIEFDPARPADAAIACADRIEAFIEGLGMPRSLSALGIARNELDLVVDHVRYEIDLLDTLGQAVTVDDVAALFDEMYVDRR